MNITEVNAINGTIEVTSIVSVLEVKPIQPDKKGIRSRAVSPREFLDALRR